MTRPTRILTAGVSLIPGWLWESWRASTIELRWLWHPRAVEGRLWVGCAGRFVYRYNGSLCIRYNRFGLCT